MDTPDAFGSIRTNPFTGAVDYLGPVGSKWTPIQNEDNCDLLDTLVDESGANYEVAGSLNGGKQVFVAMRMPEHMMIGGVDEVVPYIAACNRHDGRGALKLLVTPVRIECSNSQAAAFRQARSEFTIRHTKNHAQAMAVAREALGLTFKYIEGFQAEAEKMIQQSLTNKAFEDIAKQLVGDPEFMKGAAKTGATEKLTGLMDLFTESPTATTIRGTNWAGYQAVTEWVDFFSPIRTKGDAQQARASRAIGEKGQELKEKAFQLLSV
jgi:phage/plasmid-like protein (TIGR03299 family)